MNTLISKLKNSQNLSDPEMAQAIESIMSGGCVTSEIEAFLTFLRDKGEASSEIAAAAKVMRRHSSKLPHNYPDLLDTCGTGGDAKNTVNVSTIAAIVACAAGAQVAKHGNRSVSSVCGSADLLEMLGVKIDLSPAQVAQCLERTGFAFMFAPIFHPSVKHAMAARKNVGGKTIFNLLGPLTNPAGAHYQLLGVYSDRVLMPVASALLALGLKRAMVVHGSDGMDEITTCGPTRVVMVDEGKIHEKKLDPAMFRMKTVKHEKSRVCG